MDARYTVVVYDDLITIIDAGAMGPPGTTTVITGEEMPYAKRVDFSGSLIYRGEAEPGAAEDSPVWRIQRITIDADGDSSTQWAEGTADFSFAWSERLTLTYV